MSGPMVADEEERTYAYSDSTLMKRMGHIFLPTGFCSWQCRFLLSWG